MSGKTGSTLTNGPNAQSSGILLPALTVLDVGRRVVALNSVCQALESAESQADVSTADEHSRRRSRASETGYQLALEQTEALVDLGLTMVPQTLADVAAQLTLVDRRMDLFRASVVSEDDMRDFLGAVLHVIRSSLPIIADEAQIGLGEIFDRWEFFCSSERPKMWAGDR